MNKGSGKSGRYEEAFVIGVYFRREENICRAVFLNLWL
jgi:hypothetical protein